MCVCVCVCVCVCAAVHNSHTHAHTHTHTRLVCLLTLRVSCPLIGRFWGHSTLWAKKTLLSRCPASSVSLHRPDWLINSFLSAGPRSADWTSLSGPLMGVQPAACWVLLIDDIILSHLVLSCSPLILYRLLSFLYCHLLISSPLAASLLFHLHLHCAHILSFPCFLSLTSFPSLLFSPFIVSPPCPISPFLISFPLSLSSLLSCLPLVVNSFSSFFVSLFSFPFLPSSYPLSFLISLVPLLISSPFLPSFPFSFFHFLPCLLSHCPHILSLPLFFTPFPSLLLPLSFTLPPLPSSFPYFLSSSPLSFPFSPFFSFPLLIFPFVLSSLL